MDAYLQQKLSLKSLSISSTLLSILALVGRILTFLQTRQSTADAVERQVLKAKSKEFSQLKKAIAARKNVQRKHHENHPNIGAGTTDSVQNDKYQRD